MGIEVERDQPVSVKSNQPQHIAEIYRIKARCSGSVSVKKNEMRGEFEGKCLM